MKLSTRFSLVVLLLLAAPALVRGEDQGSLVIVGGGLRFSQTDVWSRIIALAGGPGSKIAVFPTASSEPHKNGGRVVDALRRMGADAFLVPLWVDKSEAELRLLAADPQLIEQVKTAGGIYFIGGSQERITMALGSSAGNRTPLLDAIWDVYRRGGVISGSSAGAAVMSQMMFRTSRGVLKSLQEGVQVGRELAPGLGFLHPDWFVEQHCLTRGRFGRSLVAMSTLGLKYGVGIDDNSAVEVSRGHELSVMGYRGALVMDLSQATVAPATKGFRLTNARLTYLDHGDTFDLQNMQLTPSAEKRSDQVFEATAASPGPVPANPPVVGDILGNSTIVDLMGRLIESRQREAIGLAFDAAEARVGPASGFEFRFYKADDSRGWYTGADGADSYTVANIHLDIRPVEVSGPLYK